MEDPARRKGILEKKEKKLRILISKESAPHKINSAIEEVREAKLSFLKGQRKIALRNQNTENLKLKENISKHLSNIGEKTDQWSTYSSEQILAKYEQKNT